MKTKNFKLLLLTCLTIVLTVLIMQSCKKEVMAPKDPSSSKSTNQGPRTRSGTIPDYTDSADFRTKYELLETNLNISIDSVYSPYSGGLTDSQLNTSLPWDLLDLAYSPLYDFETTHSFTSLFSKLEAEKVAWLTAGNDDFSTFPSNNYPADIVFMSMISEESDMVVGNKIYFYPCKIIEGSAGPYTVMAVLEIPVDDIDDYILFKRRPVEEIFGDIAIGNLGPGWISWVDVTPDEDECFQNVFNWSTTNYSTKRKYYWKNGFQYDLIKSTTGSMMEAYYETNLLGWVPNVIDMKVGVQEHTYNKDCGDKSSAYSSNSFVCSILHKQHHIWAESRSVKKGEPKGEHQTFGTHSSYNWHALTW